MTERPAHIPDHWAWATVDELTAFVTSGSRGWAKHSAEDGPIFLRVGNLNHHTVTIDLTDPAHVRPPAGSEGERTKVLPGDVLLSITAEVGMVGLVGPALRDAYVNQHVALLRPLPSTSPSGLAYAFLDPQGLQALARKTQYGATKPGLSLVQVRRFPVGVPPDGEQRRLVGVLESYLSRLDNTVATLERVQLNLKRYRASVLKAAVEGWLVPTEAELARAEGRDYEPASVLLEAILVERRRRWEEAELARAKAKGTTPKDDRWKERYEPPVVLDEADLPALPAGWAWATLDAIAELKGGVTKGQRVTGGTATREVAYLRVANVQRGYLDLSTIKTIHATQEQIDELRLVPGDLLFNEGGDRDKLGRGWVWRGETSECIHQNHVFRARLVTSELIPEFVSWFGNTSGQRYFFEHGKQTTNLASINLTKLRHLPVPVPPVAEQLRIRNQAEFLLSIADSGDHSVSNARAHAEALRRAILKWAFEGKLVDQDPNDEPASVLLERIKAERAAEAEKSVSPRRRPRSRAVKTA